MSKKLKENKNFRIMLHLLSLVFHVRGCANRYRLISDRQISQLLRNSVTSARNEQTGLNVQVSRMDQ